MNQLECVKLWLMPNMGEDQKLRILQEGASINGGDVMPDEPEVEEVLAWLNQPNHHLIAYGDLAYPYLLTKIDNPPPFISVDGHLDVLNDPQIGMVGCRSMSHYGAENAFAFAKALTEIGLVVTSGLARGIDALSHEGAMKNGGRTIGVLGTGLNEVYPREHQALARRISEDGAVVSQFPLNNGPLRHQFPMRNRLISGLSLGVLVVEAAQKSGSLITARYAMQQNREVFAIPGSIHSVTSRGCHALLKEGATLVDSLSDLLIEMREKLNAFLGGTVPSKIENKEKRARRGLQEAPKHGKDLKKEKQSGLLNYFKSGEMYTIDQLCTASNIGIEALSGMLLELEISSTCLELRAIKS